MKWCSGQQSGRRLVATGFGVLVLAMASSVAWGQVTLQLRSGDSTDSVLLEVGATANIQLVMTVAAGVEIIGFDAILLYLDDPVSGSTPGTGAQIVGFVDHDVPNLRFMSRGGAEGATPESPAALGDYQIIYDLVPGEQGLVGPANLVIDEIIIEGVNRTEDSLFFAIGLAAPTYFELDPALPPPGFDEHDFDLLNGTVDNPFIIRITPSDDAPPPSNGEEDGEEDGEGDGEEDENGDDGDGVVDGGDDDDGGGGGGGGGDDGTSGDDADGLDGGTDDDGAADGDDGDGGENGVDEGEPDGDGQSGSGDNADANGDGDSDGDTDGEQQHEGLDTDGDGLSDAEEEELGTNPELADTDGDGLSDGYEVSQGLSPLDADTDGDGLNDNVDPRPLEAGTGDSSTSSRSTPSGFCGIGWLVPLTWAFGGLSLVARRRRRNR